MGAGTGAGVVGARGEMMEMKSERMKAKSVTLIPSCGVVCIHISVCNGGGGVKLYGAGRGVVYDTRGIVGGVVDTV